MCGAACRLLHLTRAGGVKHLGASPGPWSSSTTSRVHHCATRAARTTTPSVPRAPSPAALRARGSARHAGARSTAGRGRRGLSPARPPLAGASPRPPAAARGGLGAPRAAPAAITAPAARRQRGKGGTGPGSGRGKPERGSGVRVTPWGGSGLLLRDLISPVISAGQRVGGLGGAWGAAAPGGAARSHPGSGSGTASPVFYFCFVFPLGNGAASLLLGERSPHAAG